MNNQPLVSVILPTYNRVKYIRKAIESVLGQTYRNLELIIINDGSNDKTSKVIYGFAKKDQRVKTIKNETNIGLVKSLNKGITKSKGKYIARIDDDDVWSDKQKLEKQIEFLEQFYNYSL
jgi:glycosyltransferase involved in cell wall biosynthesis